MNSAGSCACSLFLLVMICTDLLTKTSAADTGSSAISNGNSSAFTFNATDASSARTARKLGGSDDYEDLGWSSEASGGDDKKGGINGLLSKAVDSLRGTELMGKVKDLLSTITKSVDGLKGGKGGAEEEDWNSGHGYDVEHESDKPYPDIPIIDVPGKKKIGPPLTFGNYNRVGVGSFVDALAVCIATVVWLTFFGLVLPLFYGGQLGRRRRSLSEDDFDAPEANDSKLNPLTKMVSNVLENGDCFEYMLCKGAETFPSPSRRVLTIVRFAAQIPADTISQPASRIQRALTTESCDLFQCSRQ